jgi:predicted metal-binding membrane protein
MISARVSDRLFFGVSSFAFVASSITTVVWCASMSAMRGMPMPGGWTMSMTWMLMPSQTWLRAMWSFAGMWMMMMVAMMLPSLMPALWRYRQVIGTTAEPRRGALTALVAAGYFLVWVLFGLLIFPAGVALASAAMQRPALARAVPLLLGLVVVLAGALQFTKWKAHQLACCRETPGRGRALPAAALTAWRHGLRLGVHCSYCTAGLTAILLAGGVMDLRIMVVITVAITLERLAGERAARVIGVAVVVAGLVLMAKAAGPA